MDDQPDLEEGSSTLYGTSSMTVSDESKKTRSVIWTHFSWDRVKNKAKCNYCGLVG